MKLTCATECAADLTANYSERQNIVYILLWKCPFYTHDDYKAAWQSFHRLKSVFAAIPLRQSNLHLFWTVNQVADDEVSSGKS